MKGEINAKGALQRVVVYIQWFDKLPYVISKEQHSEAAGNETQTFLAQFEKCSGTPLIQS